MLYNIKFFFKNYFENSKFFRILKTAKPQKPTNLGGS